MAKYQDVERTSGLDYSTLRAEYADLERPVILTDLAADWPAVTRWTPEFFCRRYGSQRVPIYDEGFAARGGAYLGPSEWMAFGSYIELIQSEPTNKRLFLFDLFRMAPELRRDVVLPEFVDL
ncbi:MAG: cupin-like domain-containing protein, partial [Myxococcota bacterium]